MASSHGQRQYPTTASSYELKEEVGRGASAKVWRAHCTPFNETVAVKILDLERQEPANMEEIRREAQTMTLLSHPNLVKSYCSFVTEQSLWVIMPYLAGGSCLNLLKWAHPKGFDEVLIATILKAVLQALDYCHRNGLIHRDIKAGNILLDANGTIQIADFGVSASNWGSQDKKHQTFVGTPCWMAPEVMEMKQGYDFHADIWSLGITVLELAHGHAPFAKYPPMKVLMMTIQQPAPTLEDTQGKHFSKALRDFVSQCLDKDPQKRPTAAKLLEHKFIKEARKKEILVKHLLDGQPALGERTRKLRERETERRAQMNGGGKEPADREEKSRSEYARGISGWNFDVNNLRESASRETLPQVPESSTGSSSAPTPPFESSGHTSPTQPGDGGKKVTMTGAKGRFSVYEEGVDQSVIIQPAATLKPEAPLMKLTSEGSTTNLTGLKELQEGDRKGRFSVVSKPDEDEKPRRRFNVVDDVGDNPPAKAEAVRDQKRTPRISEGEKDFKRSESRERKEEKSFLARTESSTEIKTSRFSVVDSALTKSTQGSSQQQQQVKTADSTQQHPEQLIQSVPSLLADMQSMMAKSAALAAQQQEIQSMAQNAVKTLAVIQGSADASDLITSNPVGVSGRSPSQVRALSSVDDLQKMVSMLLEENQQLKRRNKELERKMTANASQQLQGDGKKGNRGSEGR